jgi:hypothetical protein
MSEPEFWPGFEIVDWQLVHDDQGVIVLMLRLADGRTMAWPMTVRIADALRSDLDETVASAVELGNLCRDCGRRHDRPERPDPDVQLPLNFDQALKELIAEEESGEH